MTAVRTFDDTAPAGVTAEWAVKLPYEARTLRLTVAYGPTRPSSEPRRLFYRVFTANGPTTSWRELPLSDFVPSQKLQIVDDLIKIPRTVRGKMVLFQLGGPRCKGDVAINFLGRNGRDVY